MLKSDEAKSLKFIRKYRHFASGLTRNSNISVDVSQKLKSIRKSAPDGGGDFLHTSASIDIVYVLDAFNN